MSQFTILQDISRELRRRIHTALSTAPDADLGLNNPETDITLSPPANDLQGSPRLSLYLYHIEPDGYLRNQRELAVGRDGLRFPPLAIQLRYLVTPLDEEEEHNQLMLGRILQHFHDTPFLASLDGVPLDNSHGANSSQLRITVEPMNMQELANVWQSLDANYRLSLSYLVRTITIDSDQGVREAKRVVEAHTAVGVMPG